MQTGLSTARQRDRHSQSLSSDVRNDSSAPNCGPTYRTTTCEAKRTVGQLRKPLDPTTIDETTCIALPSWYRAHRGPIFSVRTRNLQQADYTSVAACHLGSGTADSRRPCSNRRKHRSTRFAATTQVTRLESTSTRRESTRTQRLTAAIHTILKGGTQ